MVEVTQSPLQQRLVHSWVFAWISTWFIAVTQISVEQEVYNVLQSSWAEFASSYVSSFLNSSIYNRLKRYLLDSTDLSEAKIISSSILFMSLFFVWIPKYLVHKFAGTVWPEYIAIAYFIGNAWIMWVYEKTILQKNDKLWKKQK